MWVKNVKKPDFFLYFLPNKIWSINYYSLSLHSAAEVFSSNINKSGL